jgi:hypothetical protein
MTKGADEPFEEDVTRVVVELRLQFADSAALQSQIPQSLNRFV